MGEEGEGYESQKKGTARLQRILKGGLSEMSNNLGQQGAVYRHAYASMMYCGTPRDYEFYLATRVLFHGLRKMQPKADLVIIVSSSCPAEWLETYASDGLRLKIVDNILNPYASQNKFNHRFIHSLNKLVAWSFTEYERIVVLDADNMFLRNADELFQCGDFCAAFIDPCTFHTGLFVLKPSNETFQRIERAIGQLSSRDGGDQGFLVSFFPGLLGSPLFVPPPDGAALLGNYRLPFGYQMDTPYYNFRLKWRVPCSANSVMTFPGAQLLKPWFWWSWPLLPLCLSWHEQRWGGVGFAGELTVVLWEVFVYLTFLTIALTLRTHFPLNERSHLLRIGCPRHTDLWGAFAFSYPFALKSATTGYLTLSILLPFVLVPATCHPFLGWGLYFLGSLAMLCLVASFLDLPWLPTLTPWIGLIVSWVNMAAPLYAHGLPRMLSIGALAMVSSPFVWWAYLEIMGAIDTMLERESLFGKDLCRHKRLSTT